MSAASVETRHWALFADWCAATRNTALPATAATVEAFMAELPTGPATARRRLQAITAAHQQAGLSAPPNAANSARPARRLPLDRIGAAISAAPIGGWPTGIVGRRDAAILALIGTGQATRRQTQALTTATTIHLRPDEKPATCPACAVTRWQRTTSALATQGWRAVRLELAEMGEITAQHAAAHDCATPVQQIAQPELPLFFPIDSHGSPEIGQRISTRSITAIIARRLDLPPANNDPIDGPPEPLAPWTGADQARGLDERRRLAARLAWIDELLGTAEADLDQAMATVNTLDKQVGQSHSRPPNEYGLGTV